MSERDTSGELLLTAHAGLHMLCHATRDPVAVLAIPRGALLEVNAAFRKMFDVPDPLPLDLTIADLAPGAARALAAWDGRHAHLIPKITLKGVAGRARLLAIPATFPVQAFFHFMPSGQKTEPEGLKELLDERIEQIKDFERLRSVGEVAAVIVHELRTPLTSIRMGVESVRKSPALDTSLTRRLDAALEQVERLDRLLSGIRNFTRPYALNTKRVGARETIDAALRAVEGAIRGPQTTVAVEVRPEELELTADPDRLGEAIQNAVVNAVEAMPQGGLIHVSAAPSKRRRGWTEIRVSDRGPGIPAHLMDKMFQPFFTTKRSGTGLGLSIVKKIVELHGGFVSLKSAAGKGTTVIIELPS